MRFINQSKWAYVILSIVLIALGICIMIWPEFSALTLCYIAGGIAVVGGIVKIISYFMGDPSFAPFRLDFAFGLMSVVIGAVLLFHPGDVLLLLPIVIGLFILIDSIFKLQTAIDAKRLAVPGWWVVLLFALLCAVLGCVLIANPFEGAAALTILIGITLTAAGIENLWVAFYMARLIKKATESSNKF